jgi:divalent metal cation (Fe/Co/Zn/Cd) transporter
VQVQTLLKLSIAAAAATIAMKTLAWRLTDSAGLLSDAMESFVNLAIAGAAAVSISAAAPFGAQRVAGVAHDGGLTRAPLYPLLAIGVALNILREGAHLAWRSVEGLMDSALEPEVRAQIDRTLAEFAHQAIRFDHLVTRRAGQRRFLDVHMHMPSDWTLGRAAALRSNVEQALMNEVPGLRASIQLLPSNVEARFDQAHDDERAKSTP